MQTQLIRSVDIKFQDGRTLTILVNPEEPETAFYRESTFKGNEKILHIQEVYIANGRNRSSPGIQFGE